MNKFDLQKEIPYRRKTKTVMVGNVGVGSAYPISIQSMTNTDTRNVEATVKQIQALTEAGCEIVRLAVPDHEAAEALKKIIPQSEIPVVADIHFDYRLALASIESGVSKVRINPGNIGSEARVAEVVAAAKHYNVPIRIGVNGGSLEKEILQKYGGVTAKGIVESALTHIRMLEAHQFENTIIALKSSDIRLTYDAYNILAKEGDYPFHIGLTEAGTVFRGTIKSSMAMGALLLNGYGDTMRISLTGDPINEIKVAKEILKSLDLRDFGIKFVSCPTCGRCQLNLEKIADELETRLEGVNKSITVAVMGCAVNGPGEAKEADIGIAGGKDSALLFKKGEIIGKYSEDQIVDVLYEEIMKL